MKSESQKIADQYQQKILAKAAVLQKQLATKNGFHQYFDSILPKCRSQQAAFDITSLMYELLFDDQLFKTFNAFRMYKTSKLLNRK